MPTPNLSALAGLGRPTCTVRRRLGDLDERNAALTEALANPRASTNAIVTVLRQQGLKARLLPHRAPPRRFVLLRGRGMTKPDLSGLRGTRWRSGWTWLFGGLRGPGRLWRRGRGPWARRCIRSPPAALQLWLTIPQFPQRYTIERGLVTGDLHPQLGDLGAKPLRLLDVVPGHLA